MPSIEILAQRVTSFEGTGGRRNPVDDLRAIETLETNRGGKTKAKTISIHVQRGSPFIYIQGRSLRNGRNKCG